jgi:MFS family permease
VTTAFPGRPPATTGPTARVSAVAVAFIANGLGAPSFLPRLPARQEDLGLSDAALGTVLLGLAAGALLASPVAGRAAGRFGSRPVVVSAAIALGASLWTAGAAPHPAVLFLAFLVIGAADASLDVAMNLNGAAYERTTGRLVMNRLHGAWSLGALAGGGLAAGAAAAGVALTWQLAVVGAGLALAVVATRHGLVRGDAGASTPALAEAEVAATGHGDLACAPSAEPGDATRAERPPTPVEPPSRSSLRGRAMLTLVAATVAAALLEGGPYDWSAIRLERLGVGPGIAALGFAAFVTGMLVARLVGDHLAHRFGRRETLRGGMVLVAIGLGAGALADSAIVFGLGLLVAGAGVSGLFPLVFSAGANTPGVAAGAGAAVVSLSARAGFLIEPLLMGVLGDTVGLRWAFLVLAGLALAMAAAARHVVPSSLADGG